jgi:predicted metal-dependent hydrolase
VHESGAGVFNWPISKAPHPVVDDVVIHELAHLVHPNHSRPNGSWWMNCWR